MDVRDVDCVVVECAFYTHAVCRVWCHVVGVVGCSINQRSSRSGDSNVLIRDVI